ncbi:MAG: hypothetical protein QF463_00765 [Vicinamibacterales bacterium]|nr:hypothetical protein [Acidobacteriota bacterium]MDP6373455.1 hypothetical protein [Vicinamibacterales bacterium]MDP6607581.1 hypothetical protein [Vicinamibacterales bacterium]MQG57505.1 hypothetical protein [SAR202 cluster bacterium]HAK57278.1 hypothetical protein [Acidobacteriota bacterium]|tara:strand:- start:5069 stop:5761 length:693 start_codon:yes stop_codon:yes gene_type:complete
MNHLKVASVMAAIVAASSVVVSADQVGAQRRAGRTQPRLENRASFRVALIRALDASNRGQAVPVDARTWNRSALVEATGRRHEDFTSDDARDVAVVAAAWHETGAAGLTGREYAEFESDLERFRALTTAGAVGPSSGGMAGAGGGGVAAEIPDVCKTPPVPGEAVPEPYPNTAETSEGEEEEDDKTEDEPSIVGPQGPGLPRPAADMPMPEEFATDQVRAILISRLCNQL